LVEIRFQTIGILAEMNDRGVPFKELAAFIARNWEHL
jgi:hypothetical protein